MYDIRVTVIEGIVWELGGERSSPAGRQLELRVLADNPQAAIDSAIAYWYGGNATFVAGLVSSGATMFRGERAMFKPFEAKITTKVLRRN